MSRSPISAFLSLWTSEIRIDLRPPVRLVRARPRLCSWASGSRIRVVHVCDEPGDVARRDDRSRATSSTDRSSTSRRRSHNDQLAPLGFLIVERALAALIGGRNHVLRFLPLAAGVGSLFLFVRLAKAVLPPRAALVALTLFSSLRRPELLLERVQAVLAGRRSSASRRRCWRSSRIGRHPSRRAVLWLMAIAAWLPPGSRSRRPSSSRDAAACSSSRPCSPRGSALPRFTPRSDSVWLANFAVAYSASRAHAGPADTTMYRFWDFAFLPYGLPPTLRWPLQRHAGCCSRSSSTRSTWSRRRELQLGVVRAALAVLRRPRLAVSPISA